MEAPLWEKPNKNLTLVHARSHTPTVVQEGVDETPP